MVVERSPKNIERGDGEQEKMRKYQLPMQQKIVRDDDIMNRGRKEKTDVPKCLEKYSLIKKDISDRNGNMR